RLGWIAVRLSDLLISCARSFNPLGKTVGVEPAPARIVPMNVITRKRFKKTAKQQKILAMTITFRIFVHKRLRCLDRLLNSLGKNEPVGKKKNRFLLAR